MKGVRMKKGDIVLIDAPNVELGYMSDSYVDQIGIIERKATRRDLSFDIDYGWSDSSILLDDPGYQWMVELEETVICVHEYSLHLVEMSVIGAF